MIEKISCLDPLAVIPDARKHILYFLPVPLAIELTLQPFHLFGLLFRLQDRKAVGSFVGHDIFYDLIPHEQSV